MTILCKYGIIISDEAFCFTTFHHVGKTIPLESPILIVKNQTIGEAEESFISKRDKESNHRKQVEFDRARALLKWAACCNANLVEMHNADHKLKVYLSFFSMEDMIQFRDSMATNVSGATMK